MLSSVSRMELDYDKQSQQKIRLKKTYEEEYLLYLTASASDQTENPRNILLRKSIEYQELDKLGQDLENIKGFRGGGFFLVDRQIVTAILGAFLTYLFILLQWPSVEEEAIPNDLWVIKRNVKKIKVIRCGVFLVIFFVLPLSFVRKKEIISYLFQQTIT